MNRLVMLVGVLVVLALAPLYALAQTQSEEKMLVGQVQSVDESGTELTLVDGTKLVTPPGAQFNPGALEEGMVVVAMYREQDDGRKVLTRLSPGPERAGPGRAETPPIGTQEVWTHHRSDDASCARSSQR